MGVDMAKPHPLLCPHVFNIAHPGSWRAHAKFWSFWSNYLAVMPRYTYIQTYICTFEAKYILYSVCESKSYVEALFKSTLLTLMLYTQMGRSVARRDPAHITPKVKLFMHTML